MLEEGVPWSARVAAGLVCLTPRSLATVAGWAAVLALGSYVACAGAQEAQAMLASLRASVGLWALILLALAYALALALPFVPGLEVGLLIMVAFGTTGVIVAYAATVLGLCLAYVAGCVLPQRLVPTRLRAGRLALRHADSAGTLAAPLLPRRFTGLAQRKLVAWVLANRYVTLAVCLNLPGNALVGGGGGIALLCGMSRQFGCVRYLLTICLATSPIPILMLTGLSHADIAATVASACSR
ncbi:MAG: hypothetical protein ABI593_09825 [Betaproteobacteria bacterium]